MIAGGKREPERRAVSRMEYKFEMHRERVRENSKDRHIEKMQFFIKLSPGALQRTECDSSLTSIMPHCFQFMREDHEPGTASKMLPFFLLVARVILCCVCCDLKESD